MAAPPTVAALLDAHPHPRRAEIDALCARIVALRPGVTMHVKWNAPSFVYAGDDRITLRLQPRDVLQVVLHRGARPKGAPDFTFHHPAVRMLAPDRGIVELAPGDVARREAELGEVFGAWLDAVAAT